MGVNGVTELSVCGCVGELSECVYERTASQALPVSECPGTGAQKRHQRAAYTCVQILRKNMFIVCIVIKCMHTRYIF